MGESAPGAGILTPTLDVMALVGVRGALAPKEPIESVKQMRRAPTLAIAFSTLPMPPTVTASETSGSSAASKAGPDRHI